MTLLWCDGYEGYGVVNNNDPDPSGIMSQKYEFVDNASRFVIREDGAIKRTDWFMYLSDSAYTSVMRTPDITTNTTVIAGIAIRPYDAEALTNDWSWPLFCFKNSSGEMCAELVMGLGTFFVKGIDNEYLGGTRAVLARRNWSYVEMKVYSHATNGTIEVRINGCPVFDLTSVNTINASGAITKVSVGDSHAIEGNQYAGIDDFYVCDGEGSKNNDFLSEVTVKSIFPDGDDSVNFSATGNGSYATNYQQVGFGNSLPTTDWVMEDTTGNKDIYTLDDSTINFDTIHGVVGWANSRYETTPATYKMICDSAGTETESANITPSSGSVFQTDIFVVEDDPDAASAWVNSTINAMKFGYEVQ
jgi:hypothetical protein